MTCASSEDSDQPGHPHKKVLGHWLPNDCTAKTDQIGLMPRDAQVDLSLHRAYKSFCSFCHASAQICKDLAEARSRRHCMPDTYSSRC